MFRQFDAFYACVVCDGRHHQPVLDKPWEECGSDAEIAPVESNERLWAADRSEPRPSEGSDRPLLTDKATGQALNDTVLSSRCCLIVFRVSNSGHVACKF